MADSTTTPTTSASTTGGFSNYMKKIGSNYMKKLGDPTSWENRFTARLAGQEPENPQTEKEFVVADIDKLKEEIESKGESNKVKNRKALPYTFIKSSGLLPKDVLDKINELLPTLKDTEQVTVTTPTKEDTVIIAKINDNWYAFITNEHKPVTTYKLNTPFLIDAVKILKHYSNPPVGYENTGIPFLMLNYKRAQRFRSDIKRRGSSLINKSLPEWEFYRSLGNVTMEFIKKYLQSIENNNGNIEISDKLNNIISISYINSPDPENASKRLKAPYAYLTSDGAAKQQTNIPKPNTTNTPHSGNIPPSNPGQSRVPGHDLLRTTENINFLRRYENILKRFE